MSLFVESATYTKHSTKSDDFNLYIIDSFSNRIFTTVKISELHSIKLKIDTEADTCMILFPCLSDINDLYIKHYLL